jgi:hypothetical protein
MQVTGIQTAVEGPYLHKKSRLMIKMHNFSSPSIIQMVLSPQRLKSNYLPRTTIRPKAPLDSLTIGRRKNETAISGLRRPSTKLTQRKS